MITLLSALALAQTQDYAFPSSPADHAEYYPTAYYDHGGADWDCGGITYSGHRGSDFGAGSFAGMDAGRDVNAAAPGIVTYTLDGEFDRCTTGLCYGGGGFGNHVRVVHADGKETVYAHLKQWSLLVSTGDFVDCGTKIGEMGSSGYSTGPHLHFQVDNTSGVAADPFDGPCSFPPSWWVAQGVYADLPDLTCDTYDTCPPVEVLTCGDTVVTANDAAGSTDSHFIHGCTDFVYSGPEIAFTVETSLDEPVTVSVTGLGADLDLFAADTDACDGRGCLAGSTSSDLSDEVVVFDAIAGAPYTVVVDGWDGAVSGFTLSVSCVGAVVDPPTEPAHTAPIDTGAPVTEPPDDPPVGEDPPVVDTAGPRSNPRVVETRRELGCGCNSGARPGNMGWLLLLLLLRRRCS